MKKIILIITFCMMIPQDNFCAAQKFTWKIVPVNGRMTGVKASGKDNVRETMGCIRFRAFHAPNGRVFKGGCTRKVAELVINAQKDMADMKSVVGHSAKELRRGYPESALGNWYVDNLMAECRRITGRKVDCGVVNYGGIRKNMPDGEILKDDIFSIFPFHNNPVYLTMRGRDVKKIIEDMAATGFQQLGGIRCVVRDGKVESVTIGGEPPEDDKIYGLATISFLLDGGDGLYLGKYALERIDLDEYIYDMILDLVVKMEADGKLVDYDRDGRVKIYKNDNLIVTD